MKVVLLIGSGDPTYREYLLRAMAEHHNLVLLDTQPLTWQAQYVEDYVQIDMSKSSALYAAKRLQEKNSIVGILTYHEVFVELTAAVAEALSLPNNPVQCAKQCRDKWLMREQFDRFGVPSAQSVLVHSQHEARTVADNIGYPVVLKPRALGGSLGVRLVEDPKAMNEAFFGASETDEEGLGVDYRGVLVEEYLDGPEVSVESVTFQGTTQIIAVTQKQTGFPPYFEEIGHLISPDDNTFGEDDLRRVTLSAHHALGIQNAVTHTEIKVTSLGPRIVEVAARLAGDLIPHLVHLATGIDLSNIAIDISLGNRPGIIRNRSNAAAIQFIYPLRSGRVKTLMADPWLTKQPWLDQIRWQVKKGDSIEFSHHSFPPRLGYIVVFGNSVSECTQFLKQAFSCVRIEID